MPRDIKQKRSPSRPSSKYDYTEINKAELSQTDNIHNFYGVVVDASFPHQFSQNNGKGKLFKCVLKVMDPSYNKEPAQIILYANKFEDLPIIQRLGDIIRIHRANIRIHNKVTPNIRQFTANMWHTSSWALYSSDKTMPNGFVAPAQGPYSFSGQKCTHQKQDTAIQQTLSKWARDYFAKNNVDGGAKTKALNTAAKQDGDFDIIAKVLHVFEIDDYTNELKIKDASGAVFFTLALKLKFPHIKNGSIVKIRSAIFDATSSRKVLVLQHYSNIMTHISSSKVAATLSKLTDSKADATTLKGNGVVVLTEVDKKHSTLENTTLHDLFHAEDKSTNTFRVCFYVTRVEPGKAVDACKLYNKSSKQTTSAKGSKGGDLIYQVQFLAKDVSTTHDNNAYKILLYTHEGLGGNFFSQKAANLHADSKAANKVSTAFGLLTRFNSWVDAVVERRNGYYFIKDTRMIY